MQESRTAGGCLCGAVQYEVEGAATEVTSCHCPMCRKQHGAAFATYGGYPNDRVRITTGADALQVYRSGPTTERRFCRVCGSSLFWVDTTGSRTWVALGTLDGDPGRAIDGHIFVGSKASWYAITDDLPQYDTWMVPPGSSETMPERALSSTGDPGQD
jgi:hypothetical protein